MTSQPETRFQGVGSSFPSVRSPPLPSQHPRGTDHVVTGARHLKNPCPIQILPGDDRTVPQAAAVRWGAAWQGLGWPHEELTEDSQAYHLRCAVSFLLGRRGAESQLCHLCATLPRGYSLSHPTEALFGG